MKIEIKRIEGSCNGCTDRDIWVNEIFIGKEVNAVHKTVSGTAIRLCDGCFEELLQAMEKEV